MTDLYILENQDKLYTLTGLELYYLVSALQALLDGYEIPEEEVAKAQDTVYRWEARLGLKKV